MSRVTLLIALFPLPAFATWTCPAEQNDCVRLLESSRQSTIEQMVAARAVSCVGRTAGRFDYVWIPVTGPLVTICDGHGAGCLYWSMDDSGLRRDRYFPLGTQDSCDSARDVNEGKTGPYREAYAPNDPPPPAPAPPEISRLD